MNKVFPNPIMLAIDTSSLEDAKSLIVKRSEERLMRKLQAMMLNQEKFLFLLKH